MRAENSKGKLIWVVGGCGWWYQMIFVTFRLRLRCFLLSLIFFGVVQVDLVNIFSEEYTARTSLSLTLDSLFSQSDRRARAADCPGLALCGLRCLTSSPG